jgi:hypothetical protein
MIAPVGAPPALAERLGTAQTPANGKVRRGDRSENACGKQVGGARGVR